MPQISIITPVYMAEKYLENCIDSILSQKYNDWELILVDDGSPDKSGLICEQFAKLDSRIQVIHKPNEGVSSARNIGMFSARGEWIYFVDSDDFIEPNTLELLVESVSNRTDLLIHGLCDDYLEKGIKFEYDYYVKKNWSIAEILEYADKKGLLRGPVCKLYKTNIIRKYNILFNKNISYGEDTIFTFEYLKYCNSVILIPFSLYHYCHRNNSLSGREYDYNFWLKTANVLRDIRLSIYTIFDMRSSYIQYIQKIYFEHLIRCVLSLYNDSVKIRNRSIRLSILSQVHKDAFLVGYHPKSLGHKIMLVLLYCPLLSDYLLPNLLFLIKFLRLRKY